MKTYSKTYAEKTHKYIVWEFEDTRENLIENLGKPLAVFLTQDLADEYIDFKSSKNATL